MSNVAHLSWVQNYDAGASVASRALMGDAGIDSISIPVLRRQHASAGIQPIRLSKVLTSGIEFD